MIRRICLVLLLALAGGCDEEPPPAAPPADDSLDRFGGDPQFDPDYNRLTPQPWVTVATMQQQTQVVVTPDALIFPAAGNDDILAWEPGRVVVSAPNLQSGTTNPFGFARKVTAVAAVGDKIVVETEVAAMEEVVQGDFQITVPPEQAVPVDVSNLDLDAIAASLYHDYDVVSMPGDELVDDADDPNDPFFGLDMQKLSLKKIFSAIKKGAQAVGKAIGKAAQAVAMAAKDVWVAVTPSSFSGSISLTSETKVSYSSQLFSVEFTKAFGSKSGHTVELFVSGSGSLDDASVAFNPGFQIGAKIPVPGHDSYPEFWLNIDSRLKMSMAMAVAIEAGLRSVDGNPVTNETADKLGELGQQAIDAAREKLLGDPDMKPVGGWKRTLYISKPRVLEFEAGPVPVVITSTVQVDLECGFEAKAGVSAKFSFAQDARFRFSMRYDGRTKQVTTTSPSFDQTRKADVQVLGAGSLVVSCGLIPRLNTFAYDSVGLFVGLRGSLVAQASYESQCNPKPTSSRPDGVVGFELDANVGIQAGARVQAPGSSFLGKKGQEAGYDIGPFELWNHQWDLYSQSWNFPNGGVGYCLPTCKDLAADNGETDVDCGGPCSSCRLGKKCARNTDCANNYFCNRGVCTTNSCGDGVIDGDETGLDCGGPCGPCPTGAGCASNDDCFSRACQLPAPGSGVSLGTCITDSCTDGQRDNDECGIDCGGARCPKCATGALCGSDADCASGFSNGSSCVATACQDRRHSPGESDVDCGGPCVKCGAGQTCRTAGDCSSRAPVCDAVKHRCVTSACADGAKDGDETDVDCGGSCGGRCASGQACLHDADCQSAVCDATGHCAAPSCTDGRRDGDETDVDCGGSCAQKCPVSAGCSGAADCTSGACNVTDRRCASSACSDGIKDGLETNVDCGGGDCPGCPSGEFLCNTGRDCASGYCSAITATCVDSSCQDGVRDGDESDVDCGGSCATRCTMGQHCNSPADCSGAGATCVNNQCG